MLIQDSHVSGLYYAIAKDVRQRKDCKRKKRPLLRKDQAHCVCCNVPIASLPVFLIWKKNLLFRGESSRKLNTFHLLQTRKHYRQDFQIPAFDNFEGTYQNGTIGLVPIVKYSINTYI